VLLAFPPDSYVYDAEAADILDMPGLIVPQRVVVLLVSKSDGSKFRVNLGKDIVATSFDMQGPLRFLLHRRHCESLVSLHKEGKLSMCNFNLVEKYATWISGRPKVSQQRDEIYKARRSIIGRSIPSTMMIQSPQTGAIAVFVDGTATVKYVIKTLCCSTKDEDTNKSALWLATMQRTNDAENQSFSSSHTTPHHTHHTTQ
jgi:hypothetical protein